MSSYWRHPDAIGIGGLRRELPWSQERFDINWREEHRQKSPCLAMGTSGYKYVLYQINQLHITSSFSRRVCDLPSKICCSLRLYPRNIISIKNTKRRRLAGSRTISIRPMCGKGETHSISHRGWEDGNTNCRFDEWGQFDRYCKLVPYYEAIDYLREMQRRRDMEISLDELYSAQWD